MNTSRLPLRTLVTTAACALLTASSFAQAPAPGAAPATGTPPATGTTPAAPGAAGAPAATPKPLSTTEKSFLKNTAKSVLFQLELSKAVKTVQDKTIAKVRDDALKGLGQVQGKVTEIATARGEKLDTELQGAEKADVERVGKAKEDKMGKEYIEAIMREAKKLDREFESASKTATDEEVKMLTINYKPRVHDVATEAEAADKAMKAPKPKGK